MKAYKDKQFLIFDFEDGKTVQYDLSTRKTIGKLGKPVNDLRGQLKNFTIEEVIESFENDNYRNFLKFVRRNNESHISNVGTLIEKAKIFSKFEQYFSAGIQNISTNFSTPITDIPNGLLKLCRKYNLKLTNELYTCYKLDPDFFTVAFSLDFYSLSSENIIEILTYGGRHDWRDVWQNTAFHKLNIDYNYNAKSLLVYFDNLMTYEALEDCRNNVREFLDYVTMMSKISPKYEKYPKNFLTSHAIASRNYNRLKQKFVEQDFEKTIDMSLEYQWKEYVFIHPKNTNEIKDEAVQQNNCVASYIEKVISGDCNILFMRRKTEPDKSLVTIEVRNGKIVQAKGKYNRDLTQEEQSAVDKYNKIKGGNKNVA